MICRTSGKIKFITRALFGGLFFALLSGALYSEEGTRFFFEAGDRVSIVERHDLRMRVNNVYQGFLTREIRYLLHYDYHGPWMYKGTVFRLEELKNRGENIAFPLDTAEPVQLSILSTGEYQVPKNEPYPLLRSFPFFPDKPIKEQEKWQAFGTRVVDPRNEGIYTTIKFLCEYQYLGVVQYLGEEVHSFRAQYATRYRRGEDIYGDPNLSSVSGKHVVAIMLSVNGDSLFMRDTVEEVYQYADGSTISLSGFILTWVKDVMALEREKIVDRVKEKIITEEIPDVEIKEVEQGILLDLSNIHFVANEAVILPQERGRLDRIFQVLASIPGRTFLVIGHTADIGSAESQYTLSVARAKTVVDEMVRRGIPANRFLYQGKGGTEPAASNETDEGRARNRRVEIIILED